MADAAPETYKERRKRRLAEFKADMEEESEQRAEEEERYKRRAEERRAEMEAERREFERRRADARAETRTASGGADWQPERHVEPAPESPPRDATDGVVPSETTASAPSGGSSGDRAAELSEKLEALGGFFAWFEVFLLDPVIKAKWEAYATIEGDHGTIHDYYRKARGLIDESSGSA